MNNYLIIATACIVVLLIIAILIKKETKTTTAETNIKIKLKTQVKPVFSSSFIQYWFAKSWEYDRWINELTMLQNIGISEIILQEIADTKDKYAVYPTKIAEYTYNDIDMVGTVLKAADSLGMKVRIGLGFNKRWWIMNAFSQRWLNFEAQINKTIVREIVEMYGSHSSFEGWYIPHEFYQLTAPTKTQQSYLNSFLKQITFEIKQNSTKDIMIAPFYKGKFSLLCSLSTWSKMVENILNGTGIDIVALQDSIGAGFNKMKLLDSLYSYTKKATDALGIKLYADTETFVVKSSKYIPASQDQISEQLSIESKYVQGFVAFSINHYQNRNIVGQEDNYNDYYNYYLANK
ncbi:hypothetical protein CPJCM30710_10560 [Clostridium polyendosporum]|uniref:DUF4434 domain-containing protein n=1 Tax=Clostridium polyendosporum TaxID=69208 RepID=A0A919RZJ9_9CLOT|nr:DUF4434 domain-containing protein [Clostridium polyendosporum]GIM28390.1 hypothetical protein CPJCM30710_10560 [Clostridium polyendosporum]